MARVSRRHSITPLLRRAALENSPLYKHAAEADQGNIHLLAMHAGIFIAAAGLESQCVRLKVIAN